MNGDTVLEDCELKTGDVIELGYTQLRVAITARVAPQTRTCRTCGQSFELLAGTSEPDECQRCEDKRKAPPTPVPARLTVRCQECGFDLSEQANSDGQAAALHDVVTYLCARCLSRKKESANGSVGPYHVLRPLGEGGMGTVYSVYQPATARLLALKRMKDLKEKMLVKRFDREVRFARDLIHPNIVRCVDIGIDTQGAPFLATEYVPGGDLESVMQSKGRLPAENAVALVCRVLDGLEYLHARQVIHRDIKPQNILLKNRPGKSSGEPDTPKISDLGLAVSYARAGGTRLTSRGTGLGTPMYMPPEQVRDAFSVRETADLYAVGVTLYYLLTGRYTFEFPTEEDVRALQKQKPDLWRKPQEALRVLMQLHRIAHPFNIILSEEPMPIRKRDPSIGSKLASVVDKAVRKNAGERFQSATEFRAALERAVS